MRHGKQMRYNVRSYWRPWRLPPPFVMEKTMPQPQFFLLTHACPVPTILANLPRPHTCKASVCMTVPRRTSSQESQELKPDVDILKGLVIKAWTICKYEYIQLLAMSYIKKEYSLDFLSSTMYDSVELSKVSRDLDSKEYRNRKVWRSWRYIRPIVVKYIPKSESAEVTRLDNGLDASVVRWFRQLVGDVRPAQPEENRPRVYISEDQWKTIDQDSLKDVLNDISEVWGYQKNLRWNYHDIFESSLLHGSLGPMTCEPMAS